MGKKIKIVKDKEGVVFQLEIDKKINKKKRNRPSAQFVKSIIEKKLKDRNVFPLNNRVGFSGEIEVISFYISTFIEGYMNQYLIENQLDII